MNGQPSPRLNTFHGPKQQLLGNHAGHAAPAWRTDAPLMTDQGVLGKGKRHQEQGSKIFLSRLPLDVDEKEVEELFKKTIGPLKECFLIYNSQGRSKGMAVVSFTRPGDAALARTKYDGKIVDGRRPLKIETVVDGNLPNNIIHTPSLLDRMGQQLKSPPVAKVTNTAAATTQVQHPGRQRILTAPPLFFTPVGVQVPMKRVRYKKGPKRIKKHSELITRDQLDKDMEDYRAAADVLG